MISEAMHGRRIEFHVMSYTRDRLNRILQIQVWCATESTFIYMNAAQVDMFIRALQAKLEEMR